MYVPTKLFFTKGVGTHREKLSSFEMALRDARIACYNLVRVSSIFPPNCKEISIDEGLKQLQPGQIVHVVMSENATAEPNRLVAASVGVAIPRDRSLFGYLSEHHAYGQTAKAAADTPRIWPPRCSRQCWESNSTPTAPGMRSARSGRSPTFFTRRKRSPRRRSATKTVYGPPSWPRPFFSLEKVKRARQ
jgi:pyruvoyl-dependent arginine decarboxylase